ncbi:unnamed protein product [Meganyctiphanes norvegica]|uniref:G-protein coupled receptors family 1 profile domain-containing protein n=1 Tax=Meganyctiphanes norvegica TaxID=48144 RepID=A0AAV2QFV3_MEGNR
MDKTYNETNFKQWLKLQDTALYSVNLSEIIDHIETVDIIDIFQLLLESLITLLSVTANTLTLMVIWKLSLSHSAQALRASLALSDLLQGLFGSGMAVWNHSYYLWCANQPMRCNYTVNLLLWEGELFVVHGKLIFILSIIYWTSWWSNNLIFLIMTVDRYLAICDPLQYHTRMSMKRTRIAIISNWITPFIYWFVFLLFQEHEMLWTSSYHPTSKMMYYIFTIKSLTVASHAIYMLYAVTIIFCMIFLSVLILYQLKKSGNISKSLREGMDESAVLAATEAIDFNKTLAISMMFEVIAVLIPPLILYYTSINNKVSGNSSSVREYSFYFTQWFVLSSTFFNFILYNLRIPAFRKQSLAIIKTGLKTCSNIFSSN